MSGSPRLRLLVGVLIGHVVAGAIYYANDAFAQQVAGNIGRSIGIYVSGTAKTVDRLNFGTGFSAVQDGGLLTLSASGGGSANNPTGCVQGSLLSAGSDGGEGSCNGNVVTVDPAGNITNVVGATFDGRDVSVDGAKLDTITSPIEKASALPSGATDGGSNGQTAWVPILVRGTGGYTYNADAGYKMPGDQCSVYVASNQLTRFVIQWYGSVVGGVDAGNAVTGHCFMRRAYLVRNQAGTLTVNVVLPEADTLSGGAGSCAAGISIDGSVVEPWAQGTAATQIRWECSVTPIEPTSNP